MSTFGNDEKGLIFNIQKFSIHDGQGIRTLIFMKGCPLECLWCSNPESQSFLEEIMYVKKNCIQCQKCGQVCPQNAVDMENLEIDRERCKACGTCTKTCYANAKKLVGKTMSVSDLMEKIEKDRIFYRNSAGGVTVGGGEPTSQPKFVAALLKECKRLNIHTAIETCGYGQWDAIKEIFDYLDQVFFDLKHMDAAEHQRLTGVSNGLILENAKNIAEKMKDVTFRIPLIPGYNDEEENIRRTGEWVKALMTDENDLKVEILPYHALGTDKYTWLDKEYQVACRISSDAAVKKRYDDILKSCGCKVVE